MIEIKDVTKKFKDQTVLDGVTLTCPTGEITGIIGHNGSGKSVLFKCICGLLYADSGEIRVDGQEMKRGGKMIQDAGVIIENPSFLENETGWAGSGTEKESEELFTWYETAFGDCAGDHGRPAYPHSG